MLVKQSKRYLWVLFPLMLITGSLLVIYTVHLPLVFACVNKGKTLYHHYARKNESGAYEKATQQAKKEIIMLDSLLLHIENKQALSGGKLVDELYSYADSSGFVPGKIESGTPHILGDHLETALSVTGTGTYRAIGMFTEKIENCAQSTRIRQLTVKKGEQGTLESFFDVVILEQAGAADR